MPINEVRNTVLAIANKNNYGYISPQDFNLYCQQAQMSIFEDYFYQYNNQIVKENQRLSGTGYADIAKGLIEVIDTFHEYIPLTRVDTDLNQYVLPLDYYLINKILIYTTQLATGTTTGTNGGSTKVEDSSATFITDGVKVGDIASTITNSEVYNTIINTIVSETELIVNATSVNVWDATGKTYIIYSGAKIEEAERVSHSKITMLNNSILTTPTLSYPSYTQNALVMESFPNTISEIGQVSCQYIRYPKVPKWTYALITLGEPVFDASQADYQDFELPLSDEPILIAKICKYVGLEIREADVYQFGAEELNSEQQTQS